MNKLSLKIIFALFISITSFNLVSCALFSSTNNKKPKPKKSNIPKVSAKQIPGGTGDNWRYLGISKDNQMAIEINESSLKNNNILSLFQDRKTIINPSKFNYASITSNYKYSLSWWQMNCSLKQYTITTTSIYDNNGNLIKTYPFSDPTTPYSKITSGSIAELQYNYVCLGINRNLGY